MCSMQWFYYSRIISYVFNGMLCLPVLRLVNSAILSNIFSSFLLIYNFFLANSNSNAKLLMIACYNYYFFLVHGLIGVIIRGRDLIHTSFLNHEALDLFQLYFLRTTRVKLEVVLLWSMYFIRTHSQSHQTQTCYWIWDNSLVHALSFASSSPRQLLIDSKWYCLQ